jgi:HAD superfamily hydrolase (TIGR01549 family)
MVRGALEFLDHFQQRNIPLFLVSATPQNILDTIVERRELTSYFKKIYGAPLVKKEILLKILNDEQISPSELLYIGDTLDDGHAARNACIPFVGRIGQQKFAEDTLAFEDLAEIKKYLLQRGIA